jgi:chromosome segregation ATPase
MKNRSRLRNTLALGLAGIALAAGSASVVAQTARSGGSSGNSAQLIQQMQQLASERTALQAENDRMKKELAEITKERDALKTARASADRRLQTSESEVARAARERETAEGETEKLKERMAELVAKFRETANTLRDVESERATFKQSLTEQGTALTSCKAKNEALFKLNDEVLTRLENQGVLSRMASAEPFTKIKRVQLQNLVDEYRYQAEEQRVVPTPLGASAEATPDAIPASQR